VVEQDLVVAGIWVKFARVSRQEASLMRIAVTIWNNSIKVTQSILRSLITKALHRVVAPVSNLLSL